MILFKNLKPNYTFIEIMIKNENYFEEIRKRKYKERRTLKIKGAE